MKKYIKPELFFERYELSQNIAACGWVLNNESATACGFIASSQNEWSDMGLVIIDGNVAGCEKVATAEMYCYMTMTDNQNTFEVS